MKKSRYIEKNIAVAGAFPGVGVTHLCLCLANYLASKEKRKVILMELRENSCLFDMVKGKTVDLDGVLGYEFMNVIYITATNKETVLQLLRKRDEIIIVDMGTAIHENKEVCLNCGRILVLGSYKLWNVNRFGKFIHSIIKDFDLKKVRFLSLQTEKKERYDFYKRFNKELYSIPIILNPLCIRQKDFEQIDNLLF